MVAAAKEREKKKKRAKNGGGGDAVGGAHTRQRFNLTVIKRSSGLKVIKVNERGCMI